MTPFSLFSSFQLLTFLQDPCCHRTCKKPGAAADVYTVCAAHTADKLLSATSAGFCTQNIQTKHAEMLNWTLLVHYMIGCHHICKDRFFYEGKITLGPFGTHYSEITVLSKTRFQEIIYTIASTDHWVQISELLAIFHTPWDVQGVWKIAQKHNLIVKLGCGSDCINE